MTKMAYKEDIQGLVTRVPFDIDLDGGVRARRPTMASSMFLTNKEQGDWAEEIVLDAINEHSKEYVAVAYGRDESLAAGDPGFDEFYDSYIGELNTIGKKPDILLYRTEDFAEGMDLECISNVSKAIVGLEVRSSSFLANAYSNYMKERASSAQSEIAKVAKQILQQPYNDILRERKPEIHTLISTVNKHGFMDLDFKLPSWRSTEDLQKLTEMLRRIKKQIKVLHTRDYLSITPKVEDLVLVNRWIQNTGVRHYYLQVFFDKAYVIPFRSVLELVSDDRQEGVVYSIEKDVKNQGKSTIKINVDVGSEILGRIDMPGHHPKLKTFERGRLLYYVSFSGGKGYLDTDVLLRDVINGR